MHDAPRVRTDLLTPDPRLQIDPHDPDVVPANLARPGTVVRLPMPETGAVMIFTRKDGTCVVVADPESDPEHVERARQAATVLATLPHPRLPAA